MNLDSRRTCLGLAALCCCLVTIPFFCVHFPPATDLPQNVLLVRLFFETVGNPSSPYRIQWLTPYTLAYVPLAVIWKLVGPADAGRVCLALLGVLWVAAIHLIARARGRSAANATLASVLFFSIALYWGLISFVVGWPLFALWFIATSRE